MQRVITVRASQSDLNEILERFVSAGWKVLSATKGSEWGRVGFSYKWTIVLERPDTTPSGSKYTPQQMDRFVTEAQSSSTKKSYIKAVALGVGVLVGIALFFVILYLVLL